MTKASDVASRIEALRRREGRSLAWLSEATGIADKTLRRRMAAPDHLTLGELASITRVLGVRLEDLLQEPQMMAAAS